MSFWELILLAGSLVVVLGLLGFVIIGLLTTFIGAPFVPVSSTTLRQILKEARLKKGQKFYDLGSGDGRVIRLACSKYSISAVGFEANPFLVIYAYIICLMFNTRGFKFKWADFYKVDLSRVDVIYMFLLPEALTKLEPKIKSECKAGTLIIAHGFALKGLKHLLVKQINADQVFTTRFYLVR